MSQSIGVAVSDDLRLASGAAAGDEQARQAVSELADPIIAHQTRVFCKRFCHDNRHHYACTLFDAWGSAIPPLCDWGNGSYTWMLNDLTRAERLNKFEGRDGASLHGYLFTIANSLPFYERWKDWRFGRRVRVPTYIDALGADAGRLFLGLRDGHSVLAVAQTLAMEGATAEALAEQIIIELTQRNRLHLLDPPKTVSLTGLNRDADGDDADTQMDVWWQDDDPAQVQQQAIMSKQFTALDPVERYVLEALVIDGQEANDVLSSLARLNISIKKGVSADQTNRQQLYYFRRKALAKLAASVNLANGEEGT